MKTEYSYNPALSISIHIHILKLAWKLSGMNILDMFCHEIAHLIEHNKSLYLFVPIVALTFHIFSICRSRVYFQGERLDMVSRIADCFPFVLKLMVIALLKPWEKSPFNAD